MAIFTKKMYEHPQQIIGLIVIICALVCIILVGAALSTGRDKKLLIFLSFLPVIGMGIAAYYVVYPLRDQGACVGVKMAPNKRIKHFLDKMTLGRHNKQTDICNNLTPAEISNFLDPVKSPQVTAPSGTTPSGTTAGPKTCAQVKKDVSDKLDGFFGTKDTDVNAIQLVVGMFDENILPLVKSHIPASVLNFLNNSDNFLPSNFQDDKVDILDYVNDLVTEACTDKDLNKGYIDPKIERELKVAFLQSACEKISIPDKK